MPISRAWLTSVFVAACMGGIGLAQTPRPAPSSSPDSQAAGVRFATFNVSLYRQAAGDLAKELDAGQSESAARVAEVIQRVRPDVLLLNEFDYEASGAALETFHQKYLAIGQRGAAPIEFPHRHAGPVNTGVDSGLDLNRDGKRGTPDDAFGFGRYPGQYGMVVLSRFPFSSKPRTFQKFLWKDMPGALWPLDPETREHYYAPEIREQFRLSSKSHWDVPVEIAGQTVHFLVCHPTPPVFDGREDRNGRRNHDEIRLWRDYIDGAEYLYDDAGARGGLSNDALFVVAGDLNADPVDGDSHQGAARQLVDHPRIQASPAPQSKGALIASKASGEANAGHRGDPACDTGDFNDRSVGNLRIDYVLPCTQLELVGCGVFWPAPDEPHADLAGVSDHHLVWIEVVLPD